MSSLALKEMAQFKCLVFQVRFFFLLAWKFGLCNMDGINEEINDGILLSSFGKCVSASGKILYSNMFVLAAWTIQERI